MDDFIAHRISEEEKTTSNRTVLNRSRRRLLGCSYCKPNRGENRNRTPRQDRYKSARKGRCYGGFQPRSRDEKGRPSRRNRTKSNHYFDI